MTATKRLLVGLGLFLISTMSAFAQCSFSGVPTAKETTCSCTGDEFEILVCKGLETNSCDPLDSQLLHCGGSCYYENAGCGIGLVLSAPQVRAASAQLASPAGSSSLTTISLPSDDNGWCRNAGLRFEAWLSEKLTAKATRTGRVQRGT